MEQFQDQLQRVYIQPGSLERFTEEGWRSVR